MEAQLHFSEVIKYYKKMKSKKEIDEIKARLS